MRCAGATELIFEHKNIIPTFESGNSDFKMGIIFVHSKQATGYILPMDEITFLRAQIGFREERSFGV